MRANGLDLAIQAERTRSSQSRSSQEVRVTDKETLLKMLEEYNTAIERLRQEDPERHGLSTRTISRQLAHLEQRALQLQTRLSLLDLDGRDPSPERWSVERQENLFAHLNPWHTDSSIWAYIAVLTFLMLAVTLWAFISALAFP
jgi:hypothetical protein